MLGNYKKKGKKETTYLANQVPSQIFVTELSLADMVDEVTLHFELTNTFSFLPYSPQSTETDVVHALIHTDFEARRGLEVMFIAGCFRQWTHAKLEKKQTKKQKCPSDSYKFS